MRRLKAEWEKQKGVLVAFPHSRSDWAKNGSFKRALSTFVKLTQAIAYSQKVYILCENKEELDGLFCTKNNLIFIEANYNDTWTRDYGPISIEENKKAKLLDFQFNGWGGKFDATLDNLVNKFLYKKGIFEDTSLESIDFILEGGAIDCDGEGSLLTTKSVLLNKNRNPHMNQKEIEEFLSKKLGVDRFLWIENSYLAGDDTDGHIDMLARFVSKDTIVYISTQDREDEHYYYFKELEKELKLFKQRDGKAYNLIPLNIPEAKYKDNKRLPASYINFLITNSSVILPTYNSPKDKEAINIFREIFKGYEIIPLNALTLIEEGGSIHCSTMNLAF
ncbi:MAG: agmatine deiminase family protein [Epsilonproteobacteria bacterium]|nr:agmatine deiminase family protein [Campylobacterota bacterium]